MTSLAFRSEIALMFIVLLMAVVAQTRGIFEFVIDMASLALHIHMLSKQWEVSFAMVEMGRLPVFFFVAVLTVRSQ